MTTLMHTAQWLLKAVIHFMIISNMTLLCLTLVSRLIGSRNEKVTL